jgi:hypothetical protein
MNYKALENQFIYPIPKGCKLIFFAPPGAGVNEENHWNDINSGQYSNLSF